MGDSTLFRTDAIEARRHRLHGDVILLQPISTRILIIAFVVAMAAGLAFAAQARYARKETVSGYLVPSAGIATMHALRGGTVLEIKVGENQLVSAGQPLLVLSTDESLSSGPWVSQQVEQSLQQQKGDVRSQMSLADSRNRAQAQLYSKRIAGLEQIERQLQENLRQQAESAGLARQDVEKGRALLGKGFATERDVARLQREYLAQLDSQMAVEQRLLQVRSEIAEIRAQMMQLPTEREDRTAELRLRMADLEQRVTEAQRSKSYVLRAPVSGRVSGLQGHVGQVAAVDVPLLSIVPQGAELEAQLLVPTRSAGFIGEEQEVRLMYDAFPYQRFGLHGGRVRTVARVAMTPDQVRAPIRVEEPVYAVRVKIAAQSIHAYGRSVALQPGMSLKADILLEEQSILDWLLERSAISSMHSRRFRSSWRIRRV